MTATPGTIPALPQYQPGALTLAGTEALEIVNTTNATSAASYYILLTDLVGKAPGVMTLGSANATDLISVYRPSSGTYFGAQVSGLGGGTPGGSNLDVQYNNAGTFGGLSDVSLTARIQAFTNLLSGAVPASGGGTTNFLRADGTFAVPPGTTAPGGASLTLQYNNAGAFAGMSGTSWDDTNRSLTLTGATVTASHPVLDLSQTWNNGAVTFTGLKFNVTNTASAAASLLLDLQVGGTGVFQVSKTQALLVDGSSSAPSIAFGSHTNTGMYIVGDQLGFAMNGALVAYFSDSGYLVSNDSIWIDLDTGSLAFGGSRDLVITRDAAGILAQRNSTNAQTLRVYNTYTDATTNEYGALDWTTTANILSIGTFKGSVGGTTRDVFIVTGGNGKLATSNNSGGLQITPTWSIGWGTIDGVSANTAGLARVTNSVVEFNNGTNSAFGGTKGWMQWGGQARVTSDFPVNNSTTLVNVTGLSVTVATGRVYSFRAYLPVTGSTTAGGTKAAIGGTATATNIIYDGYLTDSNTIRGQGNATALGSAVANTTIATTVGPFIIILGTITVANAGTLTVQVAQNTANGTTTVKQGAYFIVHDMP